MSRHPWRLAVLVYAAATILYTWPLATAPTRLLGAPQGAGDPYLNAWILGWDLDTLVSAPLDVVSGRVFDANIFYPAQKTLAYSDHLLLPALVTAPVYLLSGSVVLCYNLVLLGSLLASALAMFALARGLTGSLVASLGAGLVWGFWPFHTAHLIHLQLQGMYFLPLAFLFLHRLVATTRRREAVWLGVAVGLQAVASVYIGVIAAVALVIGGVTLGVAVGRWRSGVLLRRVLLAMVVAGAIVAPCAWPYLDVQRKEGFVRTLYQAGLNAAEPVHYLRVPPDNAVYGRTGLLRPAAQMAGRPAEKSGPERELFVGVVTALLAVGATWQLGWRQRRRVIWPFVAIATAGFVLSIGPDGVRPLYAWLYDHVFGFQAIRAPARFGMLVAFGCAGLAGFGLAAVATRRPRLAWAMVVLMGVEYANAPVAYVAAPMFSTPVGQWLEEAPGPGAVVYLPLGLDADNTPFMIESLQHRRPIVNGYSGQRPAYFAGLVDTLRQFPSADALWTLRDFNVRFVVAPARVAQANAATPLVERARFGDRTIYELVWTPEIEERLERADVPAPPPAPESLPFGIGERARYRVLWSGGGSMALSAGDIEFRVIAPPANQALSNETFQFEVTAVTAPWVSGFFEARDRLFTFTRPDLLPTLHVQQLREGRRILDRAAWFDPGRRVVRTANGPAEAARTGNGLPLAPGARDPLAAFYYARAWPLAPGATLRIPVNDMGRSLTVELRAAASETMAAEGRTQTVVRVEGRVEYRVEHRRSPRATLWMTTDARHVPVVIDIDAAFGSFRAELVEYHAAPGR
ncbi:MAG: DUF3108 domain-containing protein [Acidobacteriota bacterium]